METGFNFFLTVSTEISHPSRGTTVTRSVKNVTSWFRTIVCTECITVTSINVKAGTSLPEKINNIIMEGIIRSYVKKLSAVNRKTIRSIYFILGTKFAYKCAVFGKEIKENR